jgi:hypothetical protein
VWLDAATIISSLTDPQAVCAYLHIQRRVVESDRARDLAIDQHAQLVMRQRCFERGHFAIERELRLAVETTPLGFLRESECV